MRVKRIATLLLLLANVILAVVLLTGEIHVRGAATAWLLSQTEKTAAARAEAQREFDRLSRRKPAFTYSIVAILLVNSCLIWKLRERPSSTPLPLSD